VFGIPRATAFGSFSACRAAVPEAHVAGLMARRIDPCQTKAEIDVQLR